VSERNNNNRLFGWFELVLISIGVAALIFIFIVVGMYVSTFSGNMASSQNVWAQFGDYLGGTLNPVLSFVTILILIFTGLMQRKEVLASRAEAIENSRTLKKQVAVQEEQAIEQTVFRLIEDFRHDSIFIKYKEEDMANILNVAIYSLCKKNEKVGKRSRLAEFQYDEFSAGEFLHVFMPKIDIFFAVIENSNKVSMYAKLLQVELGPALAAVVTQFSWAEAREIFTRISASRKFMIGVHPKAIYLNEVIDLLGRSTRENNRKNLENVKENFEIMASERLSKWNERKKSV